MIFKKKPLIFGEDKAGKIKMRAEFELLQRLANHSTTRFSDEGIYQKDSDNLFDLKDLIDGGLIRIEPSIINGKEIGYYKITVKGYELLRERKIRFLTFIISLIVLCISLVSLTFQILK